MNEILQTWLENLHHVVKGVQKAVVLTSAQGEGPFIVAASWPDRISGGSWLVNIAQAAARSGRAVIKVRSSEAEDTGEPLDAVACPILAGDEVTGAVAVEITSCSQEMHQAVVQQVHLSAMWLKVMEQVHSSVAVEQLAELVDTVAAALEQESLSRAARRVADEIAIRHSCTLAAIGFYDSRHVSVASVSNTSSVEHSSALVQTIADAMGEALDQGDTVVFPPSSPESNLSSAIHAGLSKKLGNASICTIPLVINRKVVGALLMARDGEKPFEQSEVEQCQRIALLLGPVLETRRREERSLVERFFDFSRKTVERFLGPGHWHFKAGAISVSVIVLWLTIASGIFTIRADSYLEAEVSQAVVAPVNGYIATCRARAGDMVKRGDVLATLDDRELLMEKRRWQSERAQLLKEYRQALSKLDRAGLAILNARRAQAEAQLKLVEQQLERTRLVAPFSGLVVKGDLSQLLGSPVERGEVLYEIASTGRYRVVMNVDDRDIGFVHESQKGFLKLSGIPDMVFGIKISRVTPVATAEHGRNFFRVEAALENSSDLMRPGMEGIGKVETGERPLIWIWTRRFVDWIRLTMWKVLP